MEHTLLEFLQIGTVAGAATLCVLLLIKHGLTFEDKSDNS